MDMGVHVPTACGGKGVCGKCQIKTEGSLSEPEARERSLLANADHHRLACTARITGDVRIWIANQETAAANLPPINLNPADSYGAAVDIGTTSVNISLVNLSQKTLHDLPSFLNPQRRYGHDVISRISAADDPAIRQKMSQMIQDAVIYTISHTLTVSGVPCDRIKHLIFSGNTTMLYLLLGLKVSSLGRSPYTADPVDFGDPCRQSALAPKISRLFPNAEIAALPVVSAFLGGDFIGGLALCHSKGLVENLFFIDLGTNGELFFAETPDVVYAASCAMGPALEGMNISRGMTADNGAVTHAWVESGRFNCRMLGNGHPRGITGTALVDILALFLDMNIVRPDGALATPVADACWPGPAVYEKTPASNQVRLWGDIAVTQKDIRNVQLAKGASATASKMILKASGRFPDDVRHVVIAGALGEHLSINNFKKLAFIPDFQHAQYHNLGNTSLAAAQQACVDKQFFHKAVCLRNRVRELNLSAIPEFNNEFIRALDFCKHPE